MSDHTSKSKDSDDAAASPGDDNSAIDAPTDIVRDTEIGGRDGPDPTRYGDWEKNGRCIDF